MSDLRTPIDFTKKLPRNQGKSQHMNFYANSLRILSLNTKNLLLKLSGTQLNFRKFPTSDFYI